MTISEAKQKLDFRWTVLSAASLLLASVPLMQLSQGSAALFIMAGVGILIAGMAARRILRDLPATAHFRAVQRMRLIAAMSLIILAAAVNYSNKLVLLVLASAMLWLVSVSSFLRIGARYVPAQSRFFPYVQYLGDFWIALFLAVWGADWMIVAGLLAVAASTAIVAIPRPDSRFLPMVILSAAALFLFGFPPAHRWFGIYLIATVSLPAWSAHHLIVLAWYLRNITASASDESAPR